MTTINSTDLEKVSYSNLAKREYLLPKHIVDLIQDAHALATLNDPDFKLVVDMIVFGKGSQQEVDDLLTTLNYHKTN